MQVFAKWSGTLVLNDDACQKFDDVVLKTLEGILACGLSSQNIKQIQLSTKFGGLGLRSLKDHTAAAYISSFSSVKTLAQTFLTLPILNPHLSSCFSSFNSKVPHEDHIASSSDPLQQKLLFSKIDRAMFFFSFSQVEIPLVTFPPCEQNYA